MQRIILLIAALALVAMGFSCSGNNGAVAGGDTPTAAYQRLFKAVKSKDTEAIKAEMTAKTLEFAKMVSSKNNTPIEKVFENGFTATTMTPNMPEIRDQRISDDMGAVEVWNTKDSKWEDLPFINEGGKWKLAVGDLFAGTFKAEAVGRGRSFREAEAANAAGKGPVEAPNAPNANATANANAVVPPAAANNTGK